MPIHLIIRFSPHLGTDDLALALARRLFARLDTRIDSLLLVPCADEELDLHYNGRLVHSQSQTGRAPRVADLLPLLDDEPQTNTP
jgi:hypothetical protein